MLRFSEKQREFLKNANHRWNIKSGATRSGKTYLDYYIIPKRIRACNTSGLIVLLGNTRGTLERNILEPMRNIWGEALVGKIGSNNTVKLFGKKCYALGADKVSQVSKLQGAGISYCYGDEITTWNEEVFNMLKSRLDKPGACFDGTCNPDTPEHWFKKFLESDADIFHQHYTIDDNPYNPESFVSELKKEYAGTIYYDRFILGKWVKGEGLIYPFFSRDVHCFNTLPKCYLSWYISIDYGTKNPCVMQLWAVDEYRRRAYLTKEYYYDAKKEQRQKTDSEYYDDLLLFSKGRVIESVIIDPSAASFKAEIRRHGYFSCMNAKNNVLDGIRFSASLLKAGKIFIHEDCKGTISEFGAYSWDEKCGEDKVIKENDHAMDALRYMAHTVLKNKGF